MLILLGLGPGNANLLTREAWDVLTTAQQAQQAVYLRTRKHPTVQDLPPNLILHDFDALYDSADNFAAVYAHITATIVTKAQQGDVIYAVPGHPLVGESTAPAILAQAQQLGITVRIVSGLSFIEPSLETIALAASTSSQQLLTLDPINGLQLCDALELAAKHHPPINPDRPALIAQIYSRAVASDVKLTLMNQYPPEHELVIVGDKTARRVNLYALDHGDYFDHLTSLYVTALPHIGSFEALQETIAHLRAPEGCPWDREQTHQSLRTTLREEAYEVLDAIDRDDMDDLKEELGDLLLNVILQAQIATEEDYFRSSDMIASIDAKLKRRHPHVFGDVQANTAGEVSVNWEKIKQQENAAKAKDKRKSTLDGIVRDLPALARAQKMVHRVVKQGFDWDSDSVGVAQRAAKVREELNEVLSAENETHRTEELGDLIFATCVLVDGYGVDAESALREASLKFERRYRVLEHNVITRQLDMKKMRSEQIDALWREAKHATS